MSTGNSLCNLGQKPIQVTEVPFVLFTLMEIFIVLISEILQCDQPTILSDVDTLTIAFLLVGLHLIF